MAHIRFLFLAAALLGASALQADTYYVDDNGSDSNPGTLAAPFGTLDHAIDQLTAGDTLYVREGTYPAILIWDKNGDEENGWIVIEGYEGDDKPVIDANGADVSAVVINESSYIYFGGFEVREGGRSGIFMWDAHDIHVGWNNVHGNQKFGIHAGTDTYNLTYNIRIEGNEVWDNVRHNVGEAASPWMQALSAYNAHHVEILGNTVYENYGEGIDYILSDYGTIKGNISVDNYGVNLYLDNATNTVVDGNFILTGWASDPTEFYRTGSNNVPHPAVGIAAANEYYYRQNRLNNLTIINNIVVRCNVGFIYWDSQASGGLDNTLIANNTFVKSEDILFVIEGSSGHSGTSVKNNIFYSESGVNQSWAPATTGITYEKNNWYGGNSSTHKSGTGDVMSDPQLADVDGWVDTDFMIASTSPCKDAGATITAVTADYFDPGVARTGTYDIGAHEY